MRRRRRRRNRRKRRRTRRRERRRRRRRERRRYDSAMQTHSGFLLPLTMREVKRLLPTATVQKVRISISGTTIHIW